MEREPLGFPLELRTPPLPAAHVEGGAQAIEHEPGTTLYDISHASNLACSLNACDLASHDKKEASMIWWLVSRPVRTRTRVVPRIFPYVHILPRRRTRRSG